ncbi:MAG: insulinase family protein [Chitinophagaceae bacterium]|jgi:predicted Zn-dependent peptidase|nr:insulinase family protein [Chitinophagaceae bacterium]
MIRYEKFTLANGLRVIVHPDHSTPMAVVNVMYDVGARDEDPHRTGFAHLFEHLMFGGSLHIPEYDEPLQMAGGENNAYTTNDLTNYYIQLPAENLETAFWLESDRMLSLAFSPDSLEVQRKVVCEEFKEHYINKPYGDVGHRLRSLCYTTHPYQWMTIGKELRHIEEARLEDVKAFFFKHYTPCNAILVVAGPVKTEEVRRLAEKWFGDIPAGTRYQRQLPAEPVQTSARRLELTAPVPLDAFYKAWHMGGRQSASYHATDLITEIMGSGASSRLYQRLVKEQRLFSNIECYHFGTIDPGMLTIEGKLVKGVTLEAAEAAVQAEIDQLLQHGVADKELQKAQHKTESVISFEDMSLMNRANNLAFYELLGDAEEMNRELDKYRQVNAAQLLQTAREVLTDANSNTLYYRAAS